MHSLRKHRHWISILMVPILMVIWLSVTCQPCFASEKPVVMKTHDCCPSMKMNHDQGKHQHGDSKTCKNNCTIHVSQQQDIHDGFSLEKHMLSLAGPSRSYGSEYLARHSSKIYPQRIEPLHLTSVFETYRVLLI